MGAAMLLAGIATLLGADKWLEAALTARMPQWLLDLTTRY
jgi:hypothetical protein